MQQVSRGIFFDDSFLGVTLGGIVYSHGIIYIDAPLRMEDARAWKTALINQHGGSHRLLISLDAHPDRTLGAKLMDCMIVAQQKTAQAYRNRPSVFKGQSTFSGASWESYSDSIGMRWAPPDITFTQQMSLHWGGPEVILEHHPGPAAGTCWAIIPSDKVIFVGDTITVDQPPFLANADLEAWQASLDVLKDSYSDFQVIAGRGGKASIQAITNQYQLLKKVAKGVERLVKRSAAPEATEDLIYDLLSGFDFEQGQKDLYMLRLRYGLYQYYARNYRPTSSLEQNIEEDDES